ncbi:MFS transporter [Thermococcus thioreducens]|uniref:MFS transporter permease n=1 Tax=Thermococcus thioreducens TaxID=277988 RepID=A0A0Q2M0D6_9EURY|nr:MFS transporter [Thermococcus thioreducens]ASJ13196.1 MFS transporter permease [Thermococcus thioreducens]KQH81513.1 MFS transporter permease [Thermococcus thioreducens]SEW20824.1 Predicted arabinose efflux permease, MFS family [Thermococcus thioreducens]
MRKRLLLLVSLGWIFNYAHRMAIPPLIPMIKAELGINNAEAGLLMTALLLPYAIIQVPAGYIGDRFGRKRLLVLSIIGYSLSSALIIFAREYWELLAVRALYGLFSGLYYAPATALISEVYRERKGSALGVFMVGPPVGSGIAPIIAVPIALRLEWRYAFLALSAMSLVTGIALTFAVRGEVSKPSRVKFSIPRNVFLLSTANFIVLAAFFGLLTFLVSFLVSAGVSFETASWLFSLLSVIGIAGSLFGGGLYDRIGRRSIAVVFGLNAFLTLILALTASPWVIIPLGLAFYSVGAIVTAYTSEKATGENLGSVMGFVNMVGFFGATVGPYFVGLLIDGFGYERAFLSIPLMYLMAWGIIRVEEKLEKREISRT